MMMVNWVMKKGIVEDIVIIGGLIGMQFVFAGNSVLMSYILSLGLDPLTIIIFSTSATFLMLSPFAIYFERKQWPDKFSIKLILKLILISFAGVTLFQSLFLKGLKLTSPAMSTAMPNLAPGLIFVIAWAFRLEKVRLSCVYSQVKIAGTMLCVVGAFATSILQSTASAASSSSAVREGNEMNPFLGIVFDLDKITGCLYLLAAVVVMSSNVVLQASALRDFPAPISLCAATSLIGVLITVVIQLFQNHQLEFNSPLFSIGNLIGYSVLAGTVGGVCVSFNGWAMKKRGPVLVSVFNPISTLISVILSVITLGETIRLGSLGGMFIMFSGLYLVLWAKGKERYTEEDDSFESEFDLEKPLLS